MRTTILVGRATRKGSEMVMVAGSESPPFPGPWSLRAIVRAGKPSPAASSGAPLRRG